MKHTARYSTSSGIRSGSVSVSVSVSLSVFSDEDKRDRSGSVHGRIGNQCTEYGV